MEIGEPTRIVTIKPLSEPVPQWTPQHEPMPDGVPERITAPIEPQKVKQ